MAKKQGSLLPVLGLEVDKPGEYIDNRATPNCKNTDIKQSVIQKRCGTTVVGATQSERIMGGAEFEVDGVKYLVRIGLTAVKEYNDTTSTWDAITGTVLTGAATDIVSIAIPQLSGKPVLVFTNGKDAIRKYTGTGNVAVLGGTPPTAKFCLDYRGYLLLAYVTSGGTTYPHRVQWCDTGAPETWTGGNSGSKDLMEDGEKITAIKRLGQYVTLHKENSIYVGYLSGDSTIFTFDRKSTGAGAVCINAIQELPTGEQIFLAKDGLRLFNGISAPLIPSTVTSELRSSMNFEYIYKCWSIVVREKDEVWIGIPMGSDSEPNTIYKFNYLTGQVYKDYRSNICAAWLYSQVSQPSWADLIGSWDSQTWNWDDSAFAKTTQIVMLADNTGLTYKRDTSVNNDNSVAIDSMWESKDYEGEEKGQLERWQQLEIVAKGNTITAEYSIDGGSSWYSLGTKTLTGNYPTDASPLMFYFDVVSSKIRFRFSNSVAGETFYLKQFVVSYIDREARA